MDKKNIYFIIDFDSTFVKVESLDKLAEIALKGGPNYFKITNKISEITKKGMNGEITFPVSLKKRLMLFKANRKHIDLLIKVLKKNITPSVKRNKEFFRKYKDRIYIISGGFKEYIYPVFKSFGISESHILANEFTYDNKDFITGFKADNLLSQTGGKVKQIRALNLSGEIYVIGDGFSDFELKKSGDANKFFVFCENVAREKVINSADYVLPNFDEFLYLLDLPRAYSYPKNRIKVLLTENINSKAYESFTNEGYSVEVIPNSLDEASLIKAIKDVSVLGIRSKTKITQKVLDSADRLLAIGTYCIGTDQVDTEFCSKKGVIVFNAPFSNTRSVVELVIGEIIMLFRRTFEKSAKMHKGIWDKSIDYCHEIRGKRLGIIGYGNIGSQLSLIAESLGMEVYYYDIVDKLALGNAKLCSSIDEVLRIADVVSVHVDGRKENINLIGSREFARMKKGAYFLNLSRGFVVDIKALAKSIKSGHINGVSIDVYTNEPKEKIDSFKNILQGLSNVIMTPHIGGNTLEAQEAIGEFVTNKIINFINSGDTYLSVNFPEVRLPKQKNSHRIIHIHHNVPGVLAQVNGIYSDHGVNILGQYLSTNNEIGIVITDVNKNHNPDIVNHLKNIKATIKLRILY
ncbi:3-phosphoglycerate dehydrogenase [Candidatus Woesebacteria bacterium RIFCSPHIGHO2_01_FULL_38_9b]|uniref:D-3-phosphoglycerate dehydrogenase n=1 Tax=Candidatus Woesebacteria bacterium RIFCSPHIGHO2_01_FULL_38_9b TaxID=1802493 RepID=A0A1F7Y1V4_9BACT|nr:MAG: 3-phosphoglycerate dehydrogenase [Candidatus Woesebacteria bacterium RIFCSPHIGHO2_01_FULL_38_9b]